MANLRVAVVALMAVVQHAAAFCPMPADSTGVDFSDCLNKSDGETCSVTCTAPFQGADAIYTCNNPDAVTNEFSGDLPVCGCTFETIPDANAILDECESVTAGETCNIANACTGSFVSTTTVATCEDTGRFTYTSPECHCAALSAIPGVDFDDCAGKKEGETCITSCQTGYTGVQKTLTCGIMGSFTGISPTCIDRTGFAGGTISWQKSGAPTRASIELTVTWMLNRFVTTPSIGTTWADPGTGVEMLMGYNEETTGNPVKLAGSTIQHVVTQVDANHGVVVTKANIAHTFPNDVDEYEVSYNGCCRSTQLENNAVGAYKLIASVNFAETAIIGDSRPVNRSPKARLGTGVVVVHTIDPAHGDPDITIHLSETDDDRDARHPGDDHQHDLEAGHVHEHGLVHHTHLPVVKDVAKCTLASAAQTGVGSELPTPWDPDFATQVYTPINQWNVDGVTVDPDTCVVTITGNIPHCDQPSGCYTISVMVKDYDNEAAYDAGAPAKSQVMLSFMVRPVDVVASLTQHVDHRPVITQVYKSGTTPAAASDTPIQCVVNFNCQIVVKASFGSIRESTRNPSMMWTPDIEDDSERTFSFKPLNPELGTKTTVCFHATQPNVVGLGNDVPSDTVCQRVEFLAQAPVWSGSMTPEHDTTYTMYAGEETKFTIKATDPNPGYKLKISTLIDPGQPQGSVFDSPTSATAATGVFSWTPSSCQYGVHRVCFTAMTLDINCDNDEVAQHRCVNLDVKAPVPSCKANEPAEAYFTRVGMNRHFDVTIDEANAPHYKVHSVAGSRYTNPTHGLPVGATYVGVGENAGPKGVVNAVAGTAGASGKFSWTAVRGQEGFNYRICFAGGDVFDYRMVTCCTDIEVQKCKYVVQAGDSLVMIAENYDTDYMQLWMTNPHLKNPGAILPQHSSLDVGVTYTARQGDSLSDLAQRFGMYDDIDRILAVNPDLYFRMVSGREMMKPPQDPDYTLYEGDHICVVLPTCTYKHPYTHSFGSTGKGPDNGGRNERDALVKGGQVGTLDQLNEDRGAVGYINRMVNLENNPADPILNEEALVPNCAGIRLGSATGGKAGVKTEHYENGIFFG